MPFDVLEARTYIAGVRWQFAKTMPQWPHECTVRSWYPDLDTTFCDFAQMIWQAGIVKPWPADMPNPRYRHTYLENDGWDYWTMSMDLSEITLINRARLVG